MFGLDFLFAAALWALPLAGLPVLLHMLFRRKSPVIPFSTLRFVKASVQQTAARRRIQRWILLTCRILLLALLIGAVSQPVRMLATGWFETGRSTVAAVVVDTSYSMLLKQQEVTLLEKANDIVLDLLRQPLRDAKVAVFRSLPQPAGSPEQLIPAARVLSEWSNLRPEPNPKPLSERCGAAIKFLNQQQASQKWLIIISDGQSREFPAPLPPAEDARIVFFDLHPDKPVSDGVTSVHMDPEQPIPGIGAQAVVEVSGHAGDAAFASLNITRLDGQVLKAVSNQQAAFQSTGRTQIRVPLPQGLPVEKWLLVTAQLQRQDDLAWDNSRSQLVELPPRQTVTFIDAPTQPAASNFVRLALDPWEGKVAEWPLEVRRSRDLGGSEQVVFMPLTEWPDVAKCNRLVRFVRSGGTLVLLLQPGLEEQLAKLTAQQRTAMLALLPSVVAAPAGGVSMSGVGAYRPVAPAKPDRLVAGLIDPGFRMGEMIVRRFVPFTQLSDPAAATLLYLSPVSADSRAGSFGLLYRRQVGGGTAFTFATLPDGRYLNPPVHPILLPLLVNMALRPPEQRSAQNVELGQKLVLSGGNYARFDRLELQGPAGRYVVDASNGPGGREFVFDRTVDPGLYYWRKPNDALPLAIANVQLPAAESDLIYKAGESVVGNGPNTLVVRSFAELQASMARLKEPEPKWTWPIVFVLLLICAEALLGSTSHLWKPVSLKQILGGRVSTAGSGQ